MSAEAITQFEGDNNQELLPSDLVILISSATGGSGSSSLAHELAGSIDADPIYVGQRVRQLLNARDDTDLLQKLGEVSTLDKNGFDRHVYSGLPNGRVVIEGKKAIVEGPKYLADRPYIRVLVGTNPVLAATRIARREGVDLLSLIKTPPTLVDYVQRVQERTGFHDSQFGSNLSQHADYVFDTGQLATTEIVANLTGTQGLTRAQEFAAVSGYVAKIDELTRAMIADPNIFLDEREAEHVKHSLARIGYLLENRFFTIISSQDFKSVRQDIREALTGAMYPIFRMMPKFYLAADDELKADTNSHSWSPEYYKLARGLPVLKNRLEGKNILDPFAGAGTMMTYLSARGIPQSITYGDLCYVGGPSILHDKQNSPVWYKPMYNVFLYGALLDQLPSAYRPECQLRTKGFVTLNTNDLPFADGQFDMVFGDPPYGINLEGEGGPQVLQSFLPELLRVTKEGCLLLIPTAWNSGLQQELGDRVEFLTDDLSRHSSKIPTCLAMFHR